MTDAQKIFNELFVLELANNHWGDVKRGVKIIEEFGAIVRESRVKAAIKLQMRDVPNFIHKDFKYNNNIRYVSKTAATELSKREFEELVQTILGNHLIPMCTPFDEASVDLCVDLGIPILKIASSDIGDRHLIRKIVATKKPVIASTGGASLSKIDELVNLFGLHEIPLAINHCVSLYPTSPGELELNQILFLKNRYPGNVIGFSTHEYGSVTRSIALAYALGARTFERHIDMIDEMHTLSSYCIQPFECSLWFESFKMTKSMLGKNERRRRVPSAEELNYLRTLKRGVYAKRNLLAGVPLAMEDVYFAIPVQDKQVSSEDFYGGMIFDSNFDADAPIYFQ